MSSPTYRQLLRDEFEERCRTNPRYSLRAFARFLQLAPSQVSEIFKGGRGISPAKAKLIAERIGMNPAEVSKFVTSVEVSHARSPKARTAARAKLEKILGSNTIQQITLDVFSMVANWHYMAILELTTLKNFRSQIGWIAKKLNLSTVEAKTAVERLLRLDLLLEKNGELVAHDGQTATGNEIPSPAIRKFHQGILEKAQQAITAQTPEERDLGATVISINTEDLPKVKERIRAFRAEMAQFLSTNPEKNAVYCLTTTFFRLDQAHDNEEKESV